MTDEDQIFSFAKLVNFSLSRVAFIMSYEEPKASSVLSSDYPICQQTAVISPEQVQLRRSSFSKPQSHSMPSMRQLVSDNEDVAVTQRNSRYYKKLNLINNQPPQPLTFVRRHVDKELASSQIHTIQLQSSESPKLWRSGSESDLLRSLK